MKEIRSLSEWDSNGWHVTSPAPRDVWEEIVRSDPKALVFHTPAWVDCVCAMGTYEDASCLYESPTGRRLVLPMICRRQRPALLTVQGSFPTSWGVGGVIAPDSVRPEDISAVFADLTSRPVLRTSILPNPLTGEAWAAVCPPEVLTVPRLAHVLDLDGGFDHVFANRFTGKKRREVRKAERKAEDSGLRVECDMSGKLISVFYDLLHISLDRWGRQQHEPLPLTHWRARRRDPLRKLQTIAEHLGNICQVWVAWLDDRPVAANIVLQGANASGLMGAMDKEIAGPTLANVLIRRLAIEDACRRGCRYYDFGESGESVSLAHWKSGFGAEAYRYAEYYVERVPLTALERGLKGIVKRLIGFKDA